jgi:predicted amidohydrolase
VTSGRDPSALENVQADLLARVRAYENGVPFVAANKCGSELGMVAYCGKSQIVDARGEIVALASETQPETLHATVALGDAGPRRGTPPAVTPRARTVGDTLRVAISFDPLPDDIAERLALLDGDYAIAPHEPGRLAMLDGALGAAEAGDETVLDPGGLVAYRRAGYALICWTSALPAPWLERVARARALELRLYVIVFDRAQRRAFAVDPDGAIVAGTFGEYRLASFSLAAAKTAQTAVAPGTDVAAGLERVAAALGGPA